MRRYALLLLLSIPVLAANRCTGAGSSSITSTTIIEGATSSLVSDMSDLRIAQEESLREVWTKLGIPGEFPTVDFDKDMVLVKIMQVGSGGHNLSSKALSLKDNMLMWEVLHTSPGPNCMSTQSLMTVYLLIQTPKRDNKLQISVTPHDKAC